MNANANARRRTGSPCPEQAPAADKTIEIDGTVVDVMVVTEDGTTRRPSWDGAIEQFFRELSARELPRLPADAGLSSGVPDRFYFDRGPEWNAALTKELAPASQGDGQ